MSETNTKQKIFETMYQLIAKKGYDKTSTAQIADIIGIKKSSIYYYFKSKEDIFLQIAIGLYKPDYYKRFTLLSNSISPESYKENLILAGEEYIDSYFENPELRKVIAEIDIQTTRIPALMEFVKKSDLNFTSYINKAMDCGVAIGAFPPSFNPQINAQILYTTLIGIDQAILYDLSVNPKQVWKEVVLKLF